MIEVKIILCSALDVLEWRHHEVTVDVRKVTEDYKPRSQRNPGVSIFL
jgi:hypothetical protein